jgi:hypothetical protein
MTKLNELVTVYQNEKPTVDFELSLDNDDVVGGYVPVKSTLDVLRFLTETTGNYASYARAVNCYGTYGTGKSKLCTVLARLFRDGFECPALQPVWNRLQARGEDAILTSLKDVLMPAERPWRNWLIVSMYGQAGGGTLTTALIRSLIKAVRRAKIDERVLGNTKYQAAAHRLQEMVATAPYQPKAQSPFATAEQLKRALEEPDEEAFRQFLEYHKTATHGVDFEAYMQGVPNVAMACHEVYMSAAEAIQRHGYDGILILWDEFGFAIEELLRDARRGVRRMGQETMDLQDFLQKACGTNELGKRIVFLGFTHVSIPEYGSREGLQQTDQDRLDTVSGRFKNPPIPIRLGLTEMEGYHLLAGMMLRTTQGTEVFRNPVPALQQIAQRMPRHRLWGRLTPAQCHDDIVTPCYPIHPATSAALLTLSDQVAQENRTTFFYLHDRQANGLLSILTSRDVPSAESLGTGELVRVHDLFEFFAQAIRLKKPQLFEQYEEAAARLPDATELEKQILRTVLILSIINNPDMPRTTQYLSFCLCDAFPEEVAARPLHEAMARLSAAGSLWKNEATEVWEFIGGRGLMADIEGELEKEKALIPAHSPTQLLLRFPALQTELIDPLGDIELDPCEKGTVRQIGIRVLDPSKGDDALEPINPALKDSSSTWRSGLIYLVAADNAEALDGWRQRVQALPASNLYFIFPPAPFTLGTQVRDFLAVTKLLARHPSDSHNHKVLEGKLTRLRRELRQQIGKVFGNGGLRSGTAVVKAGPEGQLLPVASWNELLPSVAEDIDRSFAHQIKVRCGMYNEWQEQASWPKVAGIVKAILTFDSDMYCQTRFLGYTETGQEAAIVDGVLVENNLLREIPLQDKWELVEIDAECSLEAMREILRHLTVGTGDKEFAKLYAKLIEPPYGVPNAIIPILVALVFRTEGGRIGVYEKGRQTTRVTDSELHEAIVRMAKDPGTFVTRYTRLTGRQRVVFRAVGPLIGVEYTDRLASGDQFMGYCEQVRKELRTWAMKMPEAVVQLQTLNLAQRNLLKILRSPVVPPQLTVLADSLVAVCQEDENAGRELEVDKTVREFPGIDKLWKEFRARVERHVDGIKAPVRSRLREITSIEPTNDLGASAHIAQKLKDLSGLCGDDNPLGRVVEKLDAGTEVGDLVEEVAAAISSKAASSLTDEDYGRAAGVLEMAASLPAERGTVILPSGERRSLQAVTDEAAEHSITADVRGWRGTLGLSPDQLASLALKAIYSAVEQPTAGEEQPGSGVDVQGAVRPDEAAVVQAPRTE